MWYTREMFTPEGLEYILKDFIKEKESMEFKLNNLLSQVNDIKKNHFVDLFRYENMKRENPNLIPDKNVLVQLKTLERNPTYLELKKEIDALDIGIKRKIKEIEKRENSLNDNFKFHEKDMEGYIFKFPECFDDVNQMTVLMEEIFNNEFQSKKLYKIVNLQRNYDIFELLVEKAPTEEYQSFFRDVINYQMYLNQRYEEAYKKEYRVSTTKEFLHHLEVELSKLGVINA